MISVSDFLFNTPLYQKVEYDEEFIGQLQVSERSPKLFDGYNPISNCDTTYQMKEGVHYYTYNGKRTVHNDPLHILVLQCTRRGDYIYIIVDVDTDAKTICKIGQNPSVATIHIGQIKQYEKVMSRDMKKEFTRAIGLAANGIGIGSFVYLRRIFERLIFDTAQQAFSDGIINQSVFEAQRMDEKIKSLQNYLPPFMVEQKSIYGILSKGVHELSEEECLAMFDVLRASIEWILEEKLEQYEKDQRKKALSSSISSYTKQLTSKSN